MESSKKREQEQEVMAMARTNTTTSSSGGSSDPNPASHDHDGGFDFAEVDAEGTSHHSYKQDEQDEKEQIKIAKTESRHVWRTRIVLVVVLVLVAGAICGGVYYYTSNQESALFETSFYELAYKVADTFESNAARRLNAIESLSVTITSNAKSNNEKWPNVTVDDFERRVAYTLDLAAVVGIIFVPFVTGETRKGWEAYSVAHQSWLKEGLALQGRNTAENEDDELESIQIMEKTWGSSPNFTIPTEIMRVSGTGLAEETGEGPYAPFWQMAPALPVPNVVNYNGMSHPSRLHKLKAVIEKGTSLVSEAWDYADTNNPGTVGKKAALNLFLNRRGDLSLDYQDGPVSDLYVPIFEHVNDLHAMEAQVGPDNSVASTTIQDLASWENRSSEEAEDYYPNSNNANKVVGTLTAYVYWQVYFHNILPQGTNEVIAILENTCGQQFTYSITGDTVSYVGQGALYDPKYSDMVVSTGWNAFLQHDEMIMSTSTNQTAEEAKEIGQCSYQVRVYPSQDLENYYVTSTPLYFTLILVLAFVLTSSVFFLYDWAVERRNRIVMQKAVQSTEVVNTLYPAAVRDRMFENNNNNSNKNKNKLSFLNTHSAEELMAKEEDDGIIADLYENATIMFGDLSGFTEWSNGRPPKHVFRLLETLYSAFDSIAKRRAVFKVETIGDCYLAICGCPTRNDKHAVIMCRFAAECLAKMEQVIRDELVEALGPETANLKLRVGLHSGSVTAGVLRGERARFQLFGDAVNTASRMETNSLPGMIQASEATADLLVKAGRGEWLKEREGGIEAKGKGNLRTFWVQPKVPPAVSTTGTSL